MRSFQYCIASNVLICMLARPGVRYFCDLDYDPFVYMEENDKIYGSYMLSASIDECGQNIQVSRYPLSSGNRQ